MKNAVEYFLKKYFLLMIKQFLVYTVHTLFNVYFVNNDDNKAVDLIKCLKMDDSFLSSF